MRKSSPPPPAGDLERLNEELAATARAAARLLTLPRYDEAELAELDVRARNLRAAIGQAQPPAAEDDEPVILTRPGERRGWLASGG